MYHAIFQPPDQLKALVKNFYVLESEQNETIPKEYQSMADGCPEIIFQIRGGFDEYQNIPVYLKAQRSVSRRLNLQNSIGLFGIRLYPHALPQLFRIPSPELINQVIDLKDIVKGKEGFINQIIDADGTAERILLASHFLCRQISAAPDPMHELVTLVMQSDMRVNIAAMRQYIGLSERQFERRFKAVAGFTPKYYARIMRFQSTRRKYISGNLRTLAELAYLCDYADQSHFIREFKEFSGMSPSAYFRLLDCTESNETKIIKGLVIAKEQVHHTGMSVTV